MTSSISSNAAYYVVFVVTKFKSVQEAQITAPQELAKHLSRSNQLHKSGVLLMAGAFLDNPQEPLTTMAVLITREAAEDYIKNDPFVLKDSVSKWDIREWANMLA